MLGLALVFLLGLFIGGVLGGYGIALIQQIRTGRVKVPPQISLGPVKIDISALSPQTDEEGSDSKSADDWGDMAPFLEGGGSIAGGCLSLIAAGLVFLGFILPWASFDVLFLSGQVSGLSMLVQLIIGTALMAFGTLGSETEFGALSGMAVTTLLVAITAFLILVPVMGFRIGKRGLQLMQSPKATSRQRQESSRRLSRAAVLGLLPVICYLTTAVSSISSLSSIGISIKSSAIGLWVTLGGFVLAIAAGILVSTATTVADQLARPQERNVAKLQSEEPDEETPNLSETRLADNN